MTFLKSDITVEVKYSFFVSKPSVQLEMSSEFFSTEKFDKRFWGKIRIFGKIIQNTHMDRTYMIEYQLMID